MQQKLLLHEHHFNRWGVIMFTCPRMGNIHLDASDGPGRKTLLAAAEVRKTLPLLVHSGLHLGLMGNKLNFI
jgi:hypothetical protein